MDETNSPSNEPNRKKGSKKPMVASSEAGLLQQAIIMNGIWKTNPKYDLLWISQPGYEALVAKLELLIEGKGDNKSGTNDSGIELRNLDQQIDDAIIRLKAALKIKFKNEATARAYYSAFAIDFSRQYYALPIDDKERLAGLELILKGLVKYNLQNLDEGLAFWTDMRDKYVAMYKIRAAHKGNLSGEVGETNVVSDTLRLGLNCMVHQIKAWHPHNFEAVLRMWGFQRETF